MELKKCLDCINEPDFPVTIDDGSEVMVCGKCHNDMVQKALLKIKGEWDGTKE